MNKLLWRKKFIMKKSGLGWSGLRWAWLVFQTLMTSNFDNDGEQTTDRLYFFYFCRGVPSVMA